MELSSVMFGNNEIHQQWLEIVTTLPVRSVIFLRRVHHRLLSGCLGLGEGLVLRIWLSNC